MPCPMPATGPIGDGSHPSERRGRDEPARDWDGEQERRREREGW